MQARQGRNTTSWLHPQHVCPTHACASQAAGVHLAASQHLDQDHSAPGAGGRATSQHLRSVHTDAHKPRRRINAMGRCNLPQHNGQHLLFIYPKVACQHKFGRASGHLPQHKRLQAWVTQATAKWQWPNQSNLIRSTGPSNSLSNLPSGTGDSV